MSPAAEADASRRKEMELSESCVRLQDLCGDTVEQNEMDSYGGPCCRCAGVDAADR